MSSSGTGSIKTVLVSFFRFFLGSTKKRTKKPEQWRPIAYQHIYIWRENTYIERIYIYIERERKHIYKEQIYICIKECEKNRTKKKNRTVATMSLSATGSMNVQGNTLMRRGVAPEQWRP